MPSLMFVVFKYFHHVDSLGLLIWYIRHTHENKTVKRKSVAVCVRSYHIMLVHKSVISAL